MNFAYRALAVLLVTAAAGPVLAQSYGGGQQQQQPRQEQQQAQPAQTGIQPSKKALPAIAELQAAANAGDIAQVQAKAAAAQAVAATKEDHYLIGQLQLKAALAAKNYDLGATALDAIASSGLLDSGKVGQLYSSLGVEAYNAKQYANAARMFEGAVRLNPRDADALSFLGEARFASGQKAQAIDAFHRAIQAATATGAKPKEALLKRATGLAYEARSPVAADLARQWVAAYPSADSWRNAIAIYRNVSSADTEGTIDLMRLMRAAGALSVPSDFVAYVGALNGQSNFIEAQTALEDAIAQHKVDASNSQIAGLLAEVKDKPRPTDADLAAAARAAPDGMALLRVGDRYYGLGQYAKAAELYRQSLAKAGMDKDVANLHIGMALAASGDKAGAESAFRAVGGNRAGIAQLWLTYLQNQA